MAYEHCIVRIKQAAPEITDAELAQVFERIHKAALDIKAGRVEGGDVKAGAKLNKAGIPDDLVQAAAKQAAIDLQAEAALRERQAQLQITRVSARLRDLGSMTKAGINPLDAVEKTLTRDYSGRVNVESLEQRVAGVRADLGRQLLSAWDSLGNDYLGFFQSKDKLLTLVRELRGEKTGDALAAKGAKAFHDTAEQARQLFNQAGGDIGKLDDWGMPQHHSQFKVASAGKDAWVDATLPLLDRAKYVDDLGQARSDADLKAFLGKAWETIATNGHANSEPGQYAGSGKRANRHAESRQIHFKDADSVINYWDQFGEKSAIEILHGHIDTMARDIAFVEHFGPNPDMTYRTLRQQALKDAAMADPKRTTALEGRAAKLDNLYDYASGNTRPTANRALSNAADMVANLNVAGKLGGASIASLFGDKPMMEAVSHLNNLPLFQRWRTELALLNPKNKADRRLLQEQGLMLDGIRSGLQRFYEGLGESSKSGRIANAVMRITGMNAINDIRKGAFGSALMSAIGNEVKAGRDFGSLHESDIRALRNYGITEAEWNIWKQAKPDDIGLTPEAIARIPDVDAAAKRNAIVKLLGVVNTESEFAIVTPGWRERAQFYGDLQRGTAKGEIVRSVLQFKSFPWAMFQRGMDAVANADTPASKGVMTAFLIASTTIAGAMLIQTRDMLSGKDPRDMAGDNWYKFWGAAFLQGGALGIYGDFLYGANQTRYGSGILEAVSGPTLGPLLEMGLVQPANAIRASIEGKETHLMAQTVQDAKGFIPGNNIWYTKAAMEHLVWQQVMESLSPGYLSNIRSRTAKDYQQDWWWSPGEFTPDRAPDAGAAFGK
jgi:hypothetical protein